VVFIVDKKIEILIYVKKLINEIEELDKDYQINGHEYYHINEDEIEYLWENSEVEKLEKLLEFKRTLIFMREQLPFYNLKDSVSSDLELKKYKSPLELADDKMISVFERLKKEVEMTSPLLSEFQDYLEGFVDKIAAEREKAEKLRDVNVELEYIKSLAKDGREYFETAKENESSDHFKNQSIKLSEKVNKWTLFLCISIVVWVLVIYGLINSVETFKIIQIEDLIKLLPISSPFVLFVVYIISQYTKERNLEEAYKFKSAQMLVLDKHLSYFDYSLKNTNMDREQVIKNRTEFLLNTLNKIHESPLTESNKQNIKGKNALEMLDKAIGVLNKSGIKIKLEEKK